MLQINSLFALFFSYLVNKLVWVTPQSAHPTHDRIFRLPLFSVDRVHKYDYNEGRKTIQNPYMR